MITSVRAPGSSDPSGPAPLLAAIDMGYGHLRAAHALADALEVPVLCVDEEPLADPEEQRLWARARRLYEFVSRASQLPVVGGPFDFALGALTSIPDLYPIRDLSAPTMPVRYLARNARRGLGQGLLRALKADADGPGSSGQRPLLTTFYAPAVMADLAGHQSIFCVVTDTDVNRIWAPPDVARTRIRYLVPGHRTRRRLQSYGVPPKQITVTGFPLPPELLGGRDLHALKNNLAARLGRLDPRGRFRDEYGDEVDHFLAVPPPAGSQRAPLLAFAVGGAGAQAGLPRQFLPGFSRAISEGRLRVTLVAGVRPAVAAIFERAVEAAGLTARLGTGLDILLAPDLPTYFQRFNDLCAQADILWTKPSELTFFGALGLPLVMAPPVGRHEAYNLRWAREVGVGLKQRDPSSMAERILDWIDDGTLAGAAWSGFMRMPKFGTYRISDLVLGRNPQPHQAEALLTQAEAPPTQPPRAIRTTS